jgi:hypothetical protein
MAKDHTIPGLAISKTKKERKKEKHLPENQN